MLKKKVFNLTNDGPDDIENDDDDDDVSILRTLQESYNTSQDRTQK